MNSVQPFHLAIPVLDLNKMRDFYTSLFQCETGRTDTRWVDLNFYGHQLVLHQVDALDKRGGANEVDGKTVRVPHFGVVLAWNDWQALAERLKRLDTRFIVEPYIRFEGMVGEQATMFLEDPEGNALEFKAFRDPDQLFAV
jgi:extradiol dioxygenase family protein